jgi:hypothetical protein
VLDHHRGVGTRGDGRAGHDLPCCGRRQRAGWGLTSAGCAGYGQRGVGGGFRSAAGEAITRGAGKGRLIAVGAESGRQYPASGGSEGNALCWERRAQSSRTSGNCCRGLPVAGQRKAHAMDCRGSRQAPRSGRQNRRGARRGERPRCCQRERVTSWQALLPCSCCRWRR